MPFDRKRYPGYWRQFSEYIRFERAKNHCEVCNAENRAEHPETGSLVVLTVAHLDARGDVCNCEALTGFKCAKPDHVKAMCQRCHLVYDGERHKFNARRTRAKKSGQMWMLDIEARHA